MVRAPARSWGLADGITGDELLAFINQDRDVIRPDGTKGLGLFSNLRSLTATKTSAAT